MVDEFRAHGLRIFGRAPGKAAVISFLIEGAHAHDLATVRREAIRQLLAWAGDDPMTKTPRVVLQKRNGANFETVKRLSGETVVDGEILLSYTPQPLRRVAGQAQTHMWVAEWQAVPWFGIATPDLGGLDARGGVPLGTYRFFVEGDGWTLTSNAFDVVPGTLDATVMRAAGNLQISAALWAPKGWHYLDEQLPSNQPVPLRSQQLTIVQKDAGGATVATTQVAANNNGVASVAAAVGAVTVLISDKFGNTVSLPVPAL
mgnify:CR=1 FL=1